MPRDLAIDDFHITGGRVAEETAGGPPLFQPRSDLPAWPLSLPLDWNADPFGDRNWRFQLSAWRMLDGLWRRYAADPSPDLFRAAFAYAEDWHRFHKARRQASDYVWDDMATGLRAQHIAWMRHETAAGRGGLDRRGRGVLAELFDSHFRKLREPGFISSNNHGIFQAHALRLMEIVAGRSVPQNAAAEAMRAILAAQFDPHGVHREGAPFYHFFAERRFRKVRPELYPGLAEQLGAILAKAREVTPWFVRPDGAFCAVGDSEGSYPSRPPRPSEGHKVGRTAAGDPILLRDMTASGYAVVRSGHATPLPRAFHLIVSGNALGGTTHDHADTLGFELFLGGRPLLVDAGKYGYQDDAWRRYFLSDRAHNTVGRAGRAYAPDDSAAAGSCLSECRFDGGRCVIGGAVERKDGMRHARRILFDPDRELVLEDAVSGWADGDAAELRLHFHEACTLSRRDDGEIEVHAGGRVVATVRAPSEAAEADIVVGGREPLFGWRSPGYRKVVASPSLRIVMRPGVATMRTRISWRHDACAEASNA